MPEWATEINDNLRLASTQNVAFNGNTTAVMASPTEHHPFAM